MEGVYALVGGSGWASGLSPYAVGTLLGLASRHGGRAPGRASASDQAGAP